MLYRAVEEGWPEVWRAAGERGGLPGHIAQTVRGFLQCGLPRYGFTHVECERCGLSAVVAFSCKYRGLCASCGARRAEEAAAHCGAVLPRVGYRQWTLSLPRTLRWLMVKAPKRFKRVERLLVQAVWRWQRRKARASGAQGYLHGGAVAFAQLFGSALQLTPHLHVLVPEGVWQGEAFVPVAPPEVEEVEGVLVRLVKRLAIQFAGQEGEEGWPEDGLEALQGEGVQHRLPLGEGAPPPSRGRKRLAVVEGFRLHADTQVHANDRRGLERLVRYGSRGPVAEERLSLREDGRYAYATKRGPTLVLTGAQLVKRLVALVPPKGKHLTTFHGVFAPNSSRRRQLMPAPEAEAAGQTQSPTLPAPGGVPSPPPPSEGPLRPPRLDWGTLQRRTFGDDVWVCPCGGRRQVLAVITTQQAAEGYLDRLGLLGPPRPRAVAQAPPQLSLGL